MFQHDADRQLVAPGHGQHACSAIILGIAEDTVAILHQLTTSLLDALALCLHVRFVVLCEAVGCAASVYDGPTVTNMRRIQHLYRTSSVHLYLLAVAAFGT
jgi:hypothetical protein